MLIAVGRAVPLAFFTGEGAFCAWLAETLPNQRSPAPTQRVRQDMRQELAKSEIGMSRSLRRESR